MIFYKAGAPEGAPESDAVAAIAGLIGIDAKKRKLSHMFGKNGLGDHSKAKLELLRKYIKIYLRIISRDKFTDTIHIFDLFCGEGQYADDNGSPLVLYDAIKEYAHGDQVRKCKLVKIHLVFNDVKKANYLKVKHLLESRPALPACNIEKFNKDFQSLLPNILELLTSNKSDKYLFFLDPCGYKDISSANIQTLLAGNKSEIIWFIPISFIYRFANHATDSDDPSFYPLQKILSDFFPEGLPRYSNQWDFIKELLAHFKETFSGYYIDTFTIERDMNSLFCLFFFTSHIRGFEKMLEAKWALDETAGRGYRCDHNEGELFPHSETWDFPEKLSRFLQIRDGRTNKEIYEFALRNGYLPKHANNVLKELDMKGGLYCSLKTKKGCYYLGYKSHSKNPRKILQFVLK